MTRLPFTIFMAFSLLLTACVDPIFNQNHLFIELKASQDIVFPGSQITVEATVTDQFNNTPEASLTWKTNLPGVEIVEQLNTSATFRLPGAVGDTTEFTVTLTATTAETSASASYNLNIGAEPYVVLDVRQTADDGYWLLGVHSAKRINLKSDDLYSSDNRVVDISPNSQYIFLSRYLKDGSFLHSIYDTNSNTHITIDAIDIATEIEQSFWSPDSQHLILLSQTAAFTVSMDNINNAAISATSYAGIFNTVVWNDSSISNPLLVAALATNNKVSMLYIEENSLIETAVDFSSVNINSLTWQLDRLLLIANTTAISSKQLYNINPKLIDDANKAAVQRLTGGTNPTGTVSVDRFSATAVTDFSYIQRTQGTPIDFDLVDVKGGNTLPDFSSLTSAELENSIFKWSTDGSVLAILASTSNKLGLYDRNLSELSVLTLDDENSRSSHQMFWVGQPQQLVIESSTNDQRSLITVDPLNTGVFEEQLLAKFAMAISNATTTHMSLAIASQNEKQLLLIPVASDTGEHNNLVTFDANSGELKYLITLNETLLKPLSPGNFTQSTGFAAEEAHSVTQGLIELSDGTLVTAVLSADGNKIVDIIATNINGSDVMARSLIEDINSYQSIRGIVGP